MPQSVQNLIDNRWPNMTELLKDRIKLETSTAWTTTPNPDQPTMISPNTHQDTAIPPTTSDHSHHDSTQTDTEYHHLVPSYKTETPTDGNCGPAACIIAVTYEYWRATNQISENIPTILDARRLLARHLVLHSWTSLQSQGQDELFPTESTKTEEEKIHSLINDKVWMTQATCDILTQVIWTKYMATDRGFDITAADEEMPRHPINMTTKCDMAKRDNENWTKTCIVYDQRHFTVQTPTAIPQEILEKLQHQERSNVPMHIGDFKDPERRQKRSRKQSTSSQKSEQTDSKRPKLNHPQRKRKNSTQTAASDQAANKKQRLPPGTRSENSPQQRAITNFFAPLRTTAHYPIQTTPDHNDLGVT